MKLHTQIPLKKADHQIDYNSQLLLLGSCFVENMGKKLDYFKFRQLQNPFGILFHPLAIEKLVAKAIIKDSYSQTDIFFYNERWHCFDAHSELSGTSKKNLIKKLNDGLETTRKQLGTASHIIITLGTAWAYRHLASGNIVANCHKMPQKEFSKDLLSADDITTSLKKTIELVQSINRNIQFIFTVSPVRHLKDGFIENQRSKAHLISAVHNVVTDGSTLRSPRPTTSPCASYFPSYELMMDELRDYRFYERDMIHPNSLAIDYIWEKFKYAYISQEAYTTTEKVDEVQKGLQHRPFNPGSEQHRKFRKSLEAKIETIQKEYPFMEFDTW